MERPGFLVLSPAHSFGDFEHAVAPRFRLERAGRNAPKPLRTHLDTFDWRLLAAGLLLSLEEGTLTVRLETEAEPLRALLPAGFGSGRAAAAGDPPTDPGPLLAGALPEGPLRDTVAPHIGVRALVSAAAFHVSTDRMRILDDIGKTIGNLDLDEPQERTAPATARLYPLKGFSRECAAFVEAAGEHVQSVGFDEYCRAVLAAGGRVPGAYSSRVDLALEPGTPAQATAKAVMAYFLSVMRENENGIRDRVDTEHLHDFRVAVRRLRSYIGQAKGSFPPERTEGIKQDLREVQKATGPARDLDVLLLREAEYRTMLPPELSSGLDEYFEWVRNRREAAYDSLEAFLASARYADVVEGLEAYAEDPRTEPAANAEVSIGELAPRWVQKRMRRLASGIDAATTNPAGDQQMHRVRIDCKKLRYLLEITASLYPPKTAKRLVKQLKVFQNTLGDLNDVAVQERTLTEDLASLGVTAADHLHGAAAIGGLLTSIREKRPELYRAFERAAARYREQIRKGGLV